MLAPGRTRSGHGGRVEASAHSSRRGRATHQRDVVLRRRPHGPHGPDSIRPVYHVRRLSRRLHETKSLPRPILQHPPSRSFPPNVFTRGCPLLGIRPPSSKRWIRCHAAAREERSASPRSGRPSRPWPALMHTSPLARRSRCGRVPYEHCGNVLSKDGRIAW